MLPCISCCVRPMSWTAGPSRPVAPPPSRSRHAARKAQVVCHVQQVAKTRDTRAALEVAASAQIASAHKRAHGGLAVRKRALSQGPLISGHAPGQALGAVVVSPISSLCNNIEAENRDDATGPMACQSCSAPCDPHRTASARFAVAHTARSRMQDHCNEMSACVRPSVFRFASLRPGSPCKLGLIWKLDPASCALLIPKSSCSSFWTS